MKLKEERQLTSENRTISLPFTSLRLFRSQSPSVRYFARKNQFCSSEMHHSTWHLSNSQSANFHPSGRPEAAASTKAQSVGPRWRRSLATQWCRCSRAHYEIMRGRENPRETRGVARVQWRILIYAVKQTAAARINQTTPATSPPSSRPPAPPFPPRPSLSATPTGLLSSL